MQIQAYAKQQGLQLIGYYHANERYDDIELGASARKVADKLHANNALACAVLVGLGLLLKPASSRQSSTRFMACCSSIHQSWRHSCKAAAPTSCRYTVH